MSLAISRHSSCHEFKLKFTAVFFVYSAKDLVIYFCFSEKDLEGFTALSNFSRAMAVKSLILDPAQGKRYRI
jgi:hypothetical protein